MLALLVGCVRDHGPPEGANAALDRDAFVASPNDGGSAPDGRGSDSSLPGQARDSGPGAPDAAHYDASAVMDAAERSDASGTDVDARLVEEDAASDDGDAPGYPWSLSVADPSSQTGVEVSIAGRALEPDSEATLNVTNCGRSAIAGAFVSPAKAICAEVSKWPNLLGSATVCFDGPATLIESGAIVRCSSRACAPGLTQAVGQSCCGPTADVEVYDRLSGLCCKHLFGSLVERKACVTISHLGEVFSLADALTYIDAEGDLTPDIADNCLGVSNVSNVDVDRDGFGDACDNCPEVANTNQADADGDHVGDACSGAGTDGGSPGVQRVQP